MACNYDNTAQIRRRFLRLPPRRPPSPPATPDVWSVGLTLTGTAFEALAGHAAVKLQVV